MIFLFDKFKKLKGTVRNRHTISLLYERERNGLYTVSAEIPIKITDKKTVYNYHKKVKDSDFLGHYDREGRFQLHKIASVDIEDSSIFIKGVHLFFDEAKAGAIIQERRFRQSEIIDGARVAFDSIGWSVVDFDVSDTEDYIFYNVSPLEARAILVETFGFEFDYWLDFDGKNIRNKQISVKREMGKDSNKRYNYGHNVLNIKVEQDYSEIYTAVIGRGKGEDLGDDAYGRRIEYTDVEWKTPTHPMNKPKGSRVLHDENATQLFGYHEDGKVSPRTKVEIFEDIEEPAKLLRASYNWLRENSVPKAVFSLKVPDGDGLDLGDKVHVIYRDIDLVKHTRVTRVIDDLVSGNRDVEFGDTSYFKTDRRLSGVKSELKRVGGSMSSRISRLKAEFDRRFDNEVQQWKDDFEQALIDAEANVEAMRVTMTEEFEAAQKAFEVEFNQSVSDAKKHADAVADAKASQVQGNLDSFAGRHEQLVGELQGNIVNINGEIADARADVSGILGRLTVVDGSISGIEGSITGIQGSLAEVKGTLTSTKTQLESQISTARTELEQSISNTRTALEGKIESTEEALNQVGEDLGNAKTDLQKQLDEARAELDGLEIGGRNWFAKSKVILSNNLRYDDHLDLYYNVGTSRSFSIFRMNSFGLELNQKYILAYEIKSNIPELGLRTNTYINGSVSSVDNNSPELIEGEWVKVYTEPFLYHTETTASVHIYFNQELESSRDIEIRNVQINRGTILQDYQEAPEDTEQKITNINQTITNIEGELSTKVEQTEMDALSGTVSRQGTLLTQTANEVSSKAEKSVVDTLTGRVTNAESSVTQNASEIAKRLTKSVYDSDKKATDAKITQWSNTASETAEGLQRVIGRVSQAEKGVETAQTRIEAEAGRIDGVLSRTSEVEGQVRDAELAIEANADGLALRATKTEVEQAIDGIEVGGRNYMLNSSEEKYSGSREHMYYGRIDDALENIGEDELITISFDVKASTGDYLMAYNANRRGQWYFVPSPSGTFRGIGTEWVRLSFQAKVVFDEDRATGETQIEFFGTYDTGNTFSIKNVKIEKGNKATDWTPAPEDIDASISEVTDRVTTAEAEIAVHAGEISQKASQSELNRVTGRVSTAETSIIQNANEIARRLVKSDYDTDKAKIDGDITKWSNLTTETAEGLEQTISRVSTAEGKLSNAELAIKTNADSLKLTATKTEVEQAIDGIKVGGRNLLLNSNVQYETSNYNLADYPLTEAIEEGTEVTISIKGQLNSSKAYFGVYNSGGSIQTASLRPASQNSNGVYVGTFKWKVGSVSNTYLRVYHIPSSVSGVVSRIDWIKLEYGNKATDWTPAPEETEAKISKAQADIKANADEIALKATQSELNSVTGRVSSAESQLSVQAGQIALRATKKELDVVAGRVTATEASLTVMDGEISSVVGRVSSNETNISSVVQDVKSITSTVATLEGDVATQGSKIEQTEDVISSKVWMDDVASIGANVLPTSPNAWEDGSYWSSGNGNNTLPENIRLKKDLAITTYRDVQYTFTCDSLERSNVRVWMLVNYDTATGESIEISIPRGQSRTIRTIGNRIVLTAYPIAGENISISGFEHNPVSSIRVKLERGGSATPLLDVLSHIEQKADEVSIKVSELGSIDGESLLTQSDISVRADRILLGSQEIGAETLSSIISVSPRSIDMITDKLNLTGNLSAKGQIESISMSAVKADFANIFAGTADIQFIVAKHLASDAIQARHLLVTNAMAEKIIANSVMAREIKTLSLDAVEANIGSLRTQILTSNVIKSTHIAGGTALIDKIFSSTAMFERMMAKSAFVSTLNTVTIDTDQITIRRPDGARLVNNGMLQASFDVQIRPNHASSEVQFTGINYATSSDVWQTFEHFYTDHKGSKLLVSWAVDFYGPSASEYIEVRVRGFGGNNPIGTSNKKIFSNGSTAYLNHTVSLGVPDYNTIQAYLEFRRSPTGSSSQNTVRARVLRVSIID